MSAKRSVLLDPNYLDRCTNAVTPSKAEDSDVGTTGSDDPLNTDNPSADDFDGGHDSNVVLPGIVNVSLHHGTELCLWRRTDAQGRSYYAVRTLFWK